MIRGERCPSGDLELVRLCCGKLISLGSPGPSLNLFFPFAKEFLLQHLSWLILPKFTEPAP